MPKVPQDGSILPGLLALSAAQALDLQEGVLQRKEIAVDVRDDG